MSEKKSKKASGATRYPTETKEEAVAFLENFNAENGRRGGLKAACDKYGVTAVTLSNWRSQLRGDSPKKVKKAGTKKAAAPKKKVAAVAAVAAVVAVSAPAVKKASGGVVATLQRMGQIHAEMNSLQAEYDALKATL
jgi:transposase-like protein